MTSSTPLRLLQIASTSEIGGAEQLMLNVCRHGDRARIAPSIFALTGNGPLADLAREAGAQGENWGATDFALPFLIAKLRRFLREGNFDLIQPYGLRADLLVRLANRGTSVKIISSIVSINPQRRWFHYFLDRGTAKRVAAWISTSEAAKRAYLARVPVAPEKIFVVPTGIPDRPTADAARRAEARKRWSIGAEEGPVLAVIANLRPAKGHADLIAALAQLKQKWPRLICLCAGRDESGGKIPALAARAGLGANIRWLGFVADAPTIYEAADLAVLPSHWEGMPHALIEALRAGLATVATDVGGNAEVIRSEEEGLLCPAKNPSALAAAIARALEDDSARKAWGDSARKRFEEAFRVETMIERMTRIYEFVAGRGAAWATSP